MVNQLKLLGLLLLILSGCSGLDIAKAVGGAVVGGGGSPSGVSVESQIGRENTKQVGVVVGDVTNTAVDVEEAKEVTVNQSPSFWFMLLFILGWVLPSPNEMGRGIRSLFKVFKR